MELLPSGFQELVAAVESPRLQHFIRLPYSDGHIRQGNDFYAYTPASSGRLYEESIKGGRIEGGTAQRGVKPPVDTAQDTAAVRWKSGPLAPPQEPRSLSQRSTQLACGGRVAVNKVGLILPHEIAGIQDQRVIPEILRFPQTPCADVHEPERGNGARGETSQANGTTQHFPGNACEF